MAWAEGCRSWGKRRRGRTTGWETGHGAGVSVTCSLNRNTGCSELVLEEEEKEADSGCGRAGFIILNPTVETHVDVQTLGTTSRLQGHKACAQVSHVPYILCYSWASFLWNTHTTKESPSTLARLNSVDERLKEVHLKWISKKTHDRLYLSVGQLDTAAQTCHPSCPPRIPMWRKRHRETI